MQPNWPILAAASTAVAGPSLLAFNVSPSPTFLNQVLALALWGAFVVLAALATDGERPTLRALRDTALPLLALALVGASVLWPWLPGALPSALALSAIGMLAATALLSLSGAAVRASPQALPLFALFCAGWVMAWMRHQAGDTAPADVPWHRGLRQATAVALLASQLWQAWSVWPEVQQLDQHVKQAMERAPNPTINPRFWSHGWF